MHRPPVQQPSHARLCCCVLSLTQGWMGIAWLLFKVLYVIGYRK